jgi:hypothetical protein
MHRKFTLLFVLLLAGTFTCLAQSSSFSATSLNASVDATDKTSLLEMDSDNWALYADEENNLYYIDFESMSMNLSDIIVRDHKGETILREDVFDLPVNTIYEIDFNQYGKGTFEIELRSFTDAYRRTVTIR